MAVGTLSSQGLNYSTSLWSFATGLSKVHGGWKVYIKGTKYLNPDNMLGMAGGLTYQYAAGSNVLLKLPAIYFFYMSRGLDLFEQEDAFTQSYNKWMDAIKRSSPTHVHVELSKKGKWDTLVSQYSVIWFQSRAQNLWVRVQRIALCTLDLAVQSFKLLMRIMDLIEVITLDPDKISEIIDQSVLESGLNIPRCLNTLARNENIFIERLESKKKGIDVVLKMLGAKKFKADDVIDKAKGFFKDLNSLLGFWKTASQTVGDIGTTLGKQVIYDISPQCLKQVIKDNGQAPQRINFIKQDHKKKTFVYMPPDDLITVKTNKPAVKVIYAIQAVKTPKESPAKPQFQKHNLCAMTASTSKKVSSNGDLPPWELITVGAGK